MWKSIQNLAERAKWQGEPLKIGVKIDHHHKIGDRTYDACVDIVVYPTGVYCVIDYAYFDDFRDGGWIDMPPKTWTPEEIGLIFDISTVGGWLLHSEAGEERKK